MKILQNIQKAQIMQVKYDTNSNVIKNTTKIWYKFECCK